MPRYTVRTARIPEQLRVRFFVAWINDANHPDDPEGASVSWHMQLEDAERVCGALNRDEVFRARLRAEITDEVVGAIERGEATLRPSTAGTVTIPTELREVRAMSAITAQDAAPLSTDVLDHLHWLVIEPAAVAAIRKSELARLLDDRTRLISVLERLLRYCERQFIGWPSNLGVVDIRNETCAVLSRIKGDTP